MSVQKGALVQNLLTCYSVYFQVLILLVLFQYLHTGGLTDCLTVLHKAQLLFLSKGENESWVGSSVMQLDKYLICFFFCAVAVSYFPLSV